MNKKIIFGTLLLALATNSCKKDDVKDVAETIVTPNDIAKSMALNVNYGVYADLSLKSINLNAAAIAFVASPSASGLEECRNLWKSARAAWEQSEGFLYGPVASENIDPRIDSWPVDFVAIDALLAGSTDFTVEANIDALDDALKGFHPIEYILWGQNGTKTATDFTLREKEYLLALAINLKKLTAQLEHEWNATNSNPYIAHFTKPSSSNPYYTSNKAVFEEMVNAMAGICDEVASGKIGEPFTLQNPSLEESPYSSNSIADFTNNMKSVQNVYLGKYTTDGLGIEDLVRKYNLSLDNSIKAKINAAIASLGAITDPFGTAITTQQPQVQNAINAIEDLKNTLETELLPFVQQNVTN